MTDVYLDSGVPRDNIASILLPVPRKYFRNVNKISFYSRKRPKISNPYGRGGVGWVKGSANVDWGVIIIFCGTYKGKKMNIVNLARTVYHELGHLNGFLTEKGANDFVRNISKEI